MATLIKWDGTESEVKPENKSSFTLDELYTLLECDIVQMIWLKDGRSMWMDEEAKLKSPKPFINDKATMLLREAGGLPGDMILGSVLLCEDGEVL